MLLCWVLVIHKVILFLCIILPLSNSIYYVDQWYLPHAV